MEIVKAHIEIIKFVFKVIKNDIVCFGLFDNIALAKPINIIEVVISVIVIFQ